MKPLISTLLASGPSISAPAWAQPSDEITAEAINAASYSEGSLPDGQSALAARLQVLLDRAHTSPGVIDGYEGENV